MTNITIISFFSLPHFFCILLYWNESSPLFFHSFTPFFFFPMSCFTFALLFSAAVLLSLYLLCLPSCSAFLLALHWHLNENILSQQLRSKCLETKPKCRRQNAAAPGLPKRGSSLDFTTELSLNQISLECKFNPF